MTWLLAALCGAALVFSLEPFNVWPLAFAGAGGLYFLLERFPAKVLPIAAGFGLVKYGFGLSWVYVSIHVYGYASPLLAGSLVLLMAAIMTTLTWAQCVVYRRLRGTAAYLNVVLFAALWTFTEWMWTWWLSGFPWLFAGYSQLGTPLSAFAPVGGVFLVSFLVAMIGAALFALSRRNVWMLLVVAAPFATGWLIGDVRWTHAAGRQTVALVQGNTEQSVKWDADQRDAIVRTHIRLTAPYWGEVDTIIWPEGAITWWAHEADFLLERLDAEGRRSQTALVSGIPVAERVEDDVRVYNGVVVAGEGEGRYLKQILVPFGEYVPFESLLRGLIAFFDLPMSGFSEGPAEQPLLRVKGVPAVMLICYEIAFPALVARQTREAEVLLTISNDTWFGGSIGPLQHMQIARMRARELDRWVLRATNNGLTGIVNPRGEVVAEMPRFQEGVLTGEWERRQGTTPFQIVGNAPVLLLIALVLAIAARFRWKVADSSTRAE
jgi:apolipoprotein N-acyltransferase